MASSSPYFSYPVQPPRSASAWSGQPGGTLTTVRAAESRSLGSADVLESQGFCPFRAFRNTMLHAVGDGPLLRPAGPELIESEAMGGLFDGLSSNEKSVALIAAAAAGLYLWSRRGRRGRRR